MTMIYTKTVMEILYTHGERLECLESSELLWFSKAGEKNVFSNVLTMNNNIEIKNLYDVVNNWIYTRKDF